MELLAAAARTASGTSTATQIPKPLNKWLAGAALHLKVTAAATEAGDTLDVYVQHSLDGGTTFTDFVHFTQVVGNASTPVNHFAHWVALMTPTAAMHATEDAALAAGVKQGPVGELWRVKWVVAPATTTGNESFTFGVYVTPLYA